MDETTLEAYFRRLAVPRPHTADAVNLHVLHRAHQMMVPFENLSIHLSEPVLLAEDVLVDKIVTRRRGGFCYELNGAFAILLETMGAEIRRVAARVYGGDGQAGPAGPHGTGGARVRRERSLAYRRRVRQPQRLPAAVRQPA